VGLVKASLRPGLFYVGDGDEYLFVLPFLRILFPLGTQFPLFFLLARGWFLFFSLSIIEAAGDHIVRCGCFVSSLGLLGGRCSLIFLGGMVVSSSL